MILLILQDDPLGHFSPMKKFYLQLFYLFPFFFSSFCWSQSTPPTITATGDQAYCPISEINIVTNFDITDPSSTEIEALYIQISTGYEFGNDMLVLNNQSLHPTINASWSSSEGKLTLLSSDGDLTNHSDFISATKDVIFTNSSPSVSGERFFSFTIGSANYLPSTDHYYEYVSDIGITWTNARDAAQARTYFGLQGYLATLASKEEAQLAGEQAQGAGWIGGSDATTEGVWQWVTGPESGMVFWNGLANGSAPNGAFSFWNNGEPNQAGDEDYAHITAKNIGIPGAWNDLSNTGAVSGDYQPKGYIVEYGGTPGDPIVDLSAFTKIYVPEIITTASVTTCGEASVTLSASASSGQVLWFDTETSTASIFNGENFITPVLSSTTIYYVLASENGCLSGIRKPVSATINPVPIINPNITLQNCDEDGNPDGITDFNLNEANDVITMGESSLIVTYYLSSSDAEAAINAVNPSPFRNSTNNIIYARVENNSGCYEIATVILEVSTTSFPEGYLATLEACDTDTSNDGFAEFDLTETSQQMIDQFPTGQDLTVQYYENLSDAQLEKNEILPKSNYTNKNAFEQTLYVRVESEDNNTCFGIGPLLILKVNPRPKFDVEPKAIYCTNLNPIVLRTFNADGNYNYEWFDNSGNSIENKANVIVSKAGTYSVIATSDLNCVSFTKTVVVTESEIANLNTEDIYVVDGSDENSIEIQTNNLGTGVYEYSLDNDGNGSYQEEPLFNNVPPGAHMVYVRDKNYCGVAKQEVFVIGFPKFFTPNNDGINDTWQVNGVTSQPNSKIYIFDKFGKLLQQIQANGPGWDGYYNGNAMPSTDYWYLVELEDGRTKKGHFSLIRR